MKISAFKAIVLASLLILQVNENALFAQISILNKLTPSVTKDSINSNRKITFDNLNRELEFTDNLIVKTDILEFSNADQDKLIEEINSFSNSILKHGNDFKKLESEKFSHVFLISAKFNWKEYHMALRNYQSDLQGMIRDIQEKQSYFIKNKNLWEESLPELEKNLTNQIKDHILSNLKKMEKIIANYDRDMRKLISAENTVIQNIIFAEGLLREINNLQVKRKQELFTQNEGNIFSLEYKKGFKGSFSDQLQLAGNESTRAFEYFYSSVKKHLAVYIIFIVILILVLLFVRKKYMQLNFNENNRGFLTISRILIQRPALTIVALMLFAWTIFIPYSPLLLNLVIYLSTLIVLFLVLRPIVSPFINQTEVGAILLLILSNIEIFAWYYGSFSRLYMVVESLAGMVITFRYILQRDSFVKSAAQIRLSRSARIFSIIVFGFYCIGFIANIAGYVNLAVYSLRLGVYIGVISLFVYGLSTLISNIFLAGIDVFNIYYPEIITKYGKSLMTKFNRILIFFLGVLWFLGILRIAEVYELIKTMVIALLTDSVKIGSLTFTLGNMLMFLLTLYLTFVVASWIKRIFEREILSQYKLKRGMAASISLTMRMFVVFMGTLFALSLSGMDLGKIGIIAGALSVGIGFGLQNIVSNFISGLILVYEKPVQEGDTVEVDTLLGRVSNIGIRSSTIITYDGAEVVVPNSNLISNQLINWTLSDNKKRIEIKVGTSYDSNPHEVLQLLLKAALSHKNVLRFPEPVPLFVGFGDNSLDFRLLFWVPFELGIITQSEVAMNVYDIFKENNIVIPFPQLDLLIKNKTDDQIKKDKLI